MNKNGVIDSRPLTKAEMFLELSRLPDPPAPFGSAFDLRYDIPDISAVYFLYREGRIEYVGKAVDLYKRVGGLHGLRHHALESADQISWLEFDEDYLVFAEHYYIWLCRPGRNHGKQGQCLTRRIEARNLSS